MAIDRKVLDIDPAKTADAIEAFIRETVGSTLRRKGIVIGVSGGIDSAVAAALSVRALGPERVYGMILPERDSSPDSRRIALQVIESLGIEHGEFEITPALETFGVYETRDEVVRGYFPELPDDYRFRLTLPQDLLDRDRISAYRLEVETAGGEIRSARLSRDDYLEMMAANDIKQRLRMTRLYYEAERRYYIVCGTTNRAETAQGFFVKFGDGGVDIEPLADLYKSQVFVLGRHLDLPEDVLARTPSPDTYSLPVSDKDFYFCLSYDQVDLLLYALEHGGTVEEAAAALGLETEQATRAWKDLERKRAATEHLRSLPPSPDLGI